jgi:hypothetical protein
LLTAVTSAAEVRMSIKTALGHWLLALSRGH